MEKRNIIEGGRTPQATEKLADVVDAGAAAFMEKQGLSPTENKNDRPKQIRRGLRPGVRGSGEGS
jgi:hypothetical protein